MNSKSIFLLVLLFCFSTGAFAQIAEEQQEGERPAWREKVFFGGGGGIQFSNFGTFITLMPSVGYRLTPKVHGGFMGIYQYAHFRDIQRSAHNYGGSLFARYFVIPQLYITAEYEQINYEFTGFGRERDRQWVDRTLIGAGYFQQGRGNGGFYIGILYDLNFTNRAGYPYDSPFVYRVGVIF